MKTFQPVPIVRALMVFDKKDQIRISAVMIIQIFLGFLDLLGVTIIGLLGALSLNGVQSREPGNRVNSFLEFLGLANESLQTQAATLGVFAALIFLVRTVVSIALTRKILFFLSRRGAKLSAELVKKVISQPLVVLQQKSLYDNLYSVTLGVSNITVGIFGTLVMLVGDLSVLIILSLALLVVDPFMAVGTLTYFGIIGFSLYKLMHQKALTLGEIDATLNIQCNQKIAEVLNTYRESVVHNRREFYAREIGNLRYKLAEALAELAFMPNVSKYVIECSVIVGALGISAGQFLSRDAGQAVATLAIFLAAGTRIAPAVLRIQQNSIQIQRNLGTSLGTLDLIDSLKNVDEIHPSSDFVETNHANFKPFVELRNATFRYPNSTEPAISNLNLTIKPGSIVAIVGPTGSGKSTLIDLILGILQPQFGSIIVSGIKATEVPKNWPGAVSYVPQDVVINSGSIRSNIALGFPSGAGSPDLVVNALKVAQLDDYVAKLQEGVHSIVGERGNSLSGGQKQRLGIARALFTKPKLLVLDEATSALDGETEANISTAIAELKGEVTVILIAHRLSTVRDADKVVYLEGGRIVSEGSFDEVRNSVPNFDRQASLMGL
jgi:ABC-type multidrug transport system fused ATPase/permease subunit